MCERKQSKKIISDKANSRRNEVGEDLEGGEGSARRRKFHVPSELPEICYPVPLSPSENNEKTDLLTWSFLLQSSKT